MNYTYDDAAHKHAVTALSNGSSFIYDANGNMTSRQVGGQIFALTHDEENRLETVAGAATANFVYNGDGRRLLSTQGGVTTVFIGNYYEWSGSTATAVKYYYAGSQRVAMRTGSAEPLFLLGDHLGSTSKIMHDNGTLATPGGQRLYKAWGEVRYEPDGALATKRRYTGQFEEPSIGLYDYGARWYDGALGRFAQPDSIIPLVTQGTQAWDRFAGMNNNPVRYNDPSGHMVDDGCRAEGCATGQEERNKPVIENSIEEKIEYKTWTPPQLRLPTPIPTPSIGFILTPPAVYPPTIPQYNPIPPPPPPAYTTNPTINPANIIGLNLSYIYSSNMAGGLGLEVVAFPDGSIGLYVYDGSGVGVGVGASATVYIGFDFVADATADYSTPQVQTTTTFAAGGLGGSATYSESGFAIGYSPGAKFSITEMNYAYTALITIP